MSDPKEKTEASFVNCHAVLREHFDCYMFVGYTLDTKEAYTCYNAPTELQYNAVMETMRDSLANRTVPMRVSVQANRKDDE